MWSIQKTDLLILMKTPSVLLGLLLVVVLLTAALEWLVPVQVYIDLRKRLGSVTAGSGSVFKLYIKGNFISFFFQLIQLHSYISDYDLE